MVVQVKVYGFTGETKTVTLCATEEQFQTMTVRQLKEKIKEAGFFNDYDEVRLIFAGITLDEDSRLLCEYGIQHMSVIQMVLMLYGGGSPGSEDGDMGNKDGKNRSMERLSGF